MLRQPTIGVIVLTDVHATLGPAKELEFQTQSRCRVHCSLWNSDL